MVAAGIEEHADDVCLAAVIEIGVHLNVTRGILGRKLNSDAVVNVVLVAETVVTVLLMNGVE